jgi:hypothetical protein
MIELFERKWGSLPLYLVQSDINSNVPFSEIIDIKPLGNEDKSIVRIQQLL